jgi:lipopolysaccharide transport system permease protein
MSSATHTPTATIPTLHIAPPGGWFDLNLLELRHSRELLYFFYYGVHPTPVLLLLPLFLALAILTGLGVGLWLSARNAMYRDVRYVVPFLVQFWMFASPVAYPPSLVPARWRFLYGLNPMTGIIEEGFRWALTGVGHLPSVLLAASTAAVLALVLSGMMFFQKMEGVIADVV